MYYSDLLLDEASDIISISDRCHLINLEYNIIENLNVNYFETRRELKLKEYLLNEINKMKDENDIEKLKYLYFEYYGKLNDNSNIYDELINSLDKINDKHYKLSELIKLSNKKKVI